ncbi:response regulator [Mariniblastus sp.]|nr:response regulator [Mariniblastus sp.]
MSDLSKKILIVDDNEINRLILAEILEDRFQVEFAVDGESAIEKAAVFDPDLVLLDVMMPGIDGYEVCRRLRNSSRPWVKIIMVSAKIQASDRVNGYEAGADDYLGKPFDPDEMLAKVSVHLKLKHTEELDDLKYKVLRVLQHGNRAPITKILCNAEMLTEMEAEVSDEVHRRATGITKATRSLHKWLQTAETLIELKSGSMEFEPEPVSVREILTKVVSEKSELGQLFQDRVVIRLKSDQSIECDMALFEKLIVCLLADSVSRVSEGSDVALQIGPRNETELCLAVKYACDSITKKEFQSAFEPFGVADDVLLNKGDGMSLAIVREIVSLHGGRIEFEIHNESVVNMNVVVPMFQEAFENAGQAV